MPLRRATALLYLVPALAAIGWLCQPLARGTHTLYLRDVFGVHLALKGAHAEALRAGSLPLLDPLRAGGQPLAGNPNAVPFYPDNLLYLVGSTIWALNAHFWLHWLAAPFAMAWLGLVLGLERRAAFAAAIFWATSGYFLSQLNLYNEVAIVALAPALVAAFLRLAERGRGIDVAAGGALLALTLLGGDPLLAAVALVAALVAFVLRRRGLETSAAGRPRVGGLLAALALGALAALPQLVELARILPGSFRTAYGYSFETTTLTSWDPRQIVEWLVPFPFGRPDLLGAGSFWGQAFYTGLPPFYFALFGGFLLLGLIACSGPLHSLAARWSWLLIAAGLFFALGRFNPLGSWLFRLPGMRFPIKLWLWVALGATILAGLGFERVFLREEGRARRLLLAVLAGLGAAAAGGWLFFARGEAAQRFLAALLPPGRSAAFAAAEGARLASTFAVLTAVALLLLLACWLACRKKSDWPALVLALHAITQLGLLAPLVARDESLPLTVPPPVLAALPRESVVAHGEVGDLFGRGSLGLGRFPDGRASWLMRRAAWELYPAVGVLQGRRYQCNTSPEGLDSLWSRLAEKAVEGLEDARRLRLLAAFGVDHLLLVRPLADEARGDVELRSEQASFGQTLSLYHLPKALPEAQLVGTVRRAADPSDAVRQLTEAGFDPRSQTVVTEGPAAREGPPGQVELLEAEPEELRAEVSSPAGGVLVVRRAYLPLWRAWIDGAERGPIRANFQLLGLEVPAGTHQVRLATDRRPLLTSLAMSVLAWAGLALLALRRRKGSPVA